MLHPVTLRPLLCSTVVAAILLLPFGALAGKTDDPFGNCCVSRVTMTGFNAWEATCGPCAANPGRYPIAQPQPDKLVFTGPGGVTGDSPYAAAAALCRCPSQDARRAGEQLLRTFDGK